LEKSTSYEALHYIVFSNTRKKYVKSIYFNIAVKS
jgi:hypothetical protein